MRPGMCGHLWLWSCVCVCVCILQGVFHGLKVLVMTVTSADAEKEITALHSLNFSLYYYYY